MACQQVYGYLIPTRKVIFFSFTFLYGYFKCGFLSLYGAILSIDETVIGTILSGQTEPSSNGNDILLHTSQISKFGTLPSDRIWCHNHETNFEALVVFYLCRGFC